MVRMVFVTGELSSEMGKYPRTSGDDGRSQIPRFNASSN